MNKILKGLWARFIHCCEGFSHRWDHWWPGCPTRHHDQGAAFSLWASLLFLGLWVMLTMHHTQATRLIMCNFHPGMCDFHLEFSPCHPGICTVECGISTLVDFHTGMCNFHPWIFTLQRVIFTVAPWNLHRGMTIGHLVNYQRPKGRKLSIEWTPYVAMEALERN